MRNALRLLLRVAILVGAVLLLPRGALAGGSVRLATREPTEADGRWKLNMSIDFGSIPQLPHIPMIFAFTPTVLYERALTDKSPDAPVVNKIPLSNQQGINESMDVGFADASGKVFKVTKFDFVIKRDHGFEAGEYDLKIKREDDGVQMGQVIHLVLKGDNAVVDRRAMVFSADKKAKKAEAKDKPKDGDAADKAAEKPVAEAAAAKPEGDAPADSNGVPAVPPMQGGCGCRVVGDTTPASGVAIAIAGLAIAVATRRRR